jgi:hypothetical protein
MQLNLGIIKKKDEIISHRSLIKVLFNPILRTFGCQIATPYDLETKVLGWLIFTKCPKRKLIWSWNYDVKDCEVERKRRFL